MAKIELDRWQLGIATHVFCQQMMGGQLLYMFVFKKPLDMYFSELVFLYTHLITIRTYN